MRFWAGIIGLGVAGMLVVPAEAVWAVEPSTQLVAAAPAQKVPPKQWANSVCTSLRDWETNIKDLTSEFRAAGAGSTDAAQVKDELVTFLGSAVSETETLLTQLDEAGTPNFKDGNKVVGLFRNAMNDVRDLFATGQQDAMNLDPNDLTQFRAATTRIGNAITQGGTKLSKTFRSAGRKYKDANKILGAERTCRALSSSS
ncbi:MAG TPA: hypothetical protein VGO28_05645 [Acidimicrobiia bacterium]